MNEKNQKVLRGIVIAILAIVFVAFVIMYLSGQIGEFSGFTGEVSRPESFPESFSDNSAPNISSDISSVEPSEPAVAQTAYKFRNNNLLDQHFEKHGREMGFASAEEYEKAAAAVPNHPDVLHKTEQEDGDDVYYIEATNEFVIVSTDGYIRTYFNPDRGIDYYNKQ